VTSPTFESYSQNGEDVVLWRALRNRTNGRYIDVGANHPRYFSISMAFYALGWRGITIEPDPKFAQMQRDERPGDLLIEAAATAKDGESVTLHVMKGTGLSTLDHDFAELHAKSGFETEDLTVSTRRVDAVLEDAGWAGQEIHFMSVDTEGSERAVLEGIDLAVWRPWVLVIEATAPLSTESTREAWEAIVTDAGYRFCLFDGLSCFYVAEEHSDDLGRALSYPACPHDDYITLEYRECLTRLAGVAALVDEASRWRAQAMTRWATAIAKGAELIEVRDEMDTLHRKHQELLLMHHLLAQDTTGLQKQISELHHSTSWRVTRPLRFASGLFGGARRQQ